MGDEAVLDELLSLWQAEWARGHDLPATTICRERPELARELQRRIDAVRRLDGLARQEAETLVPGPREAAPAADGLRIPGYEILATLGRGGMGVVYQARQIKLGRVVALKMILSGAHAAEADLARFRTEAEAIARLQHPNIVQIHEVGEHGGLPFFSLEFCAGGSLERKLGGTPLPPKEAAALVEALARAMQAAHDKGVVHRDLKPANVLLAEDGTPKITDFGLAKKLDEAGQTATGAVMGTPSYMAPEQAGGKRAAVGPACDIYALGAILYECLTGRPPFRGPSAMDTVMQVVADEPVPPRQLQSRTPKDLETICLKCLRKEPARRYATAAALADDLGRFLAGEPIAARPLGRAARLWRWCKRKPALAGLYALLLAVALGVIFGFPAMFGHELELRLRAEANAREARDNKEAADRALADLRAEKRQTTDLFYETRINLSHREWQAGNAHRARQLLDDCPADHRGWEWDYLRGLFDERSVALNGHAGMLLGVALTPDGNRAVTIAADRSVRVWNARTGAELHSLPFQALRLALSPDGERAAIAVDRGVKVFEVATGREVRTIDLGDTVCGLGFVRGTELAVALLGGGVRYLDAATGAERSRLPAPVKFALATRELLAVGQGVAFSPDGRWLAQGGTEGKLRVWDGSTGKLVLEETAHPIIVRQVAFSPDGRRLASPGGEGDIRVWDLETKQAVLRLTGHRGFVHCVAFSPDGRSLISGAKDQTVRLWELETGENVQTLAGHSFEVIAVAFGGGSRAASAGAGGEVRVWDLDERVVYGEGVRESYRDDKLQDPARRGAHDSLTIHGYLGPPKDLAFSADARTLATVGRLTPSAHADRAPAPEVILWDLVGRRELRRLPVPRERTHHLAFSPDGRRLAVGTGTGNKNEPAELSVFDSATTQRVWHWEGPPGKEVWPAFAPGGDSLASALNAEKGGNLLIAWRAENGKELFCQPLARPHSRATYSPDGQALVTAGGVNGIVHIETYDARTGQPRDSRSTGVAVLSGDVVCGANGLVAAATLGDRPVIKLFRLADGREVASLEGHVNAVTALAFSPDGRRLVSTGGDNNVRLWDTGTGRELLTFREHTMLPSAVAWSPDGRRIGSAAQDTMINVWEARSAEPPPRTDDWPLLVRDEFTTDGDLGRWLPLLQSSWEVRGGALHGRQVSLTFKGVTFPFAGAALTGVKLPRTVEVRVAYRAARPLVMGVHLAVAADNLRSYTALLCGGDQPFTRPCTRLQRMTEAGKLSYPGLVRPFTMRPGQWHRVRVLRQPERIRVFVDDVESLNEPIVDIELPHLALLGQHSAVGDEIEFKDIEVRAPAEAGR